MSFQAAAETSKLLVTLATAVIAFCVTFINVEPGKTTLLTPATTGQKVLLVCSWLVLLVCAGAGIWVQLALTHVLSAAGPGKSESTTKSKASQNSESPVVSITIWNRAIQFPYIVQVVAFVLGMTLLVTYGGWRLFHG
jgi:hypothetical protein